MKKENSKLYTKAITLPDGTRKYVRAKTKEALEEKVTQLRMEQRAARRSDSHD